MPLSFETNEEVKHRELPKVGEDAVSSTDLATEDLVAALHAVKIRQQNEAAAQEIAALGRTLEHMGVDVAPKEVWRELNDRQNRTGELGALRTTEALQRYRNRRRLRTAAITTLALILTALSVRTIVEHYQDYRETQQNKAAFAKARREAASMPLPARSTTTPIYTNSFNLTKTTKPLGNIANGEAFRTDIQTVTMLGRLLYGTRYAKPVPMSEVKNLLLETQPPREKATWQVVRLENKFYLRGWTTSAAVAQSAVKPEIQSVRAAIPIYSSEEAMAHYRSGTQDTSLSSSVSAGSAGSIVLPAATAAAVPLPGAKVKPVQVTVPLDEFESYSASESSGEGVVNISPQHPENYRYDSWKAVPLPAAAVPRR